MAYLDRQLAPQEAAEVGAHLGRCPRCRQLLENLQAEQEEVAGLLEAYRKVAEEESRAGLQAGLRERYRVLPAGGEMRPAGPGWQAGLSGESGLIAPIKGVGWKMKNYRKILAAAAAVVLTIGLLSYAPVRGFAAQILQVFRVNRVQILHFDPRDVQELEKALQTYDRRVDIASFGEVKREQVQNFARLDAENVRIGSQKIRIPAQLGSFRRVRDPEIQPGERFAIRPRVEGLNSFLSSLGSRSFLPEELDGKTFFIQVPPVVTASYEAPGGGRYIILHRTVAPEITVPAGVNVEEVRDALLGIPVLPERMRRTLAQVNDWQNTLLIPDFMAEAAGPPVEVTVNGTRGVFIMQERPAPDLPARGISGSYGVLIWPQGFLWNALGGVTLQEALDLAAALK